MKLGNSLLCCSCDEVYELKAEDSRFKIQDSKDISLAPLELRAGYISCPSCGSGAFVCISRWIPAMEGQTRYDRWIGKIKEEMADAINKRSDRDRST